MKFKVSLLLTTLLLLGACTNIPNLLKQADLLMDTAPDSALIILKQINPHNILKPSQKAYYALLYSQALDKNDIKVESDTLIRTAVNYYDEDEPEKAGYAWFYMARCANNRGDARAQANALFKAQEYAQLTDNFKLHGLVYCDKAYMYSEQQLIDSSIVYFKLTLSSFVKANDRRNETIILLHIGSAFLKDRQCDSARYYFEIAESQIKKSNDISLNSSVYRSLAAMYYQKEAYDKALYYYRKVPLTGTDLYDSNLWYIMANVYAKTGDNDSTRFYLNKVNGLYEMAPDYYRLKQDLAEKEGNMNDALYYAKKVTVATDSLYKSKLAESFAGLEKRYKYKVLEIDNQRLIIKNKQNRIVILIVLLALSILSILFMFWKIQMNRQQLNAKNQLLVKETALLEKERENSSMLEKQLKMQEILLLNVDQYRSNSVKKVVNKVNGTISPIQNHTFYDELIACMDIEYRDISKRLKMKYPKLTEQDVLVCCLLLANFDTGKIASILDVKIESMNKARYRLRTKLGLQNSENLIEFLSNF